MELQERRYINALISHRDAWRKFACAGGLKPTDTLADPEPSDDESLVERYARLDLAARRIFLWADLNTRKIRDTAARLELRQIVDEIYGVVVEDG